MSKMKEFSMTLDEVIEAGDRLLASYKETVAACEIILSAIKDLKALFSGAEDTPAIPENPKQKPISTKKEAESQPEVKTYTKEEVRAVLAAKSGSGKRAEVKAILTKYGASQLGQLAPEHYAAVVADAEALDG